jgi:Ser/Thr protein kinase RdoA (MazF antagonist)
VGQRLVELFYFQIHRLRTLHADHHPGNFLFKADGQIGVVDFGCVKKINFDASAVVRACIARSWRRGERQARELLELIFGRRVPYSRSKKMLPTLELMVRVLFPEGNGEVDFGKGEMLRLLADAMRKSVQDKATNPEFAFVSRAELGLYSLLHRLNAKVNVRAGWDKVASRD